MRSHSRLSAESARRSADALTIARDWLATDDYVRCLRESYLRASPGGAEHATGFGVEAAVAFDHVVDAFDGVASGVVGCPLRGAVGVAFVGAPEGFPAATIGWIQVTPNRGWGCGCWCGVRAWFRLPLMSGVVQAGRPARLSSLLRSERHDRRTGP